LAPFLDKPRAACNDFSRFECRSSLSRQPDRCVTDVAYKLLTPERIGDRLAGLMMRQAKDEL
jgi:hypothetical protein